MPSWLLLLCPFAFALSRRGARARLHPSRATSERGQATAEYVLVLLGAASVALVLIGWLARSGRIEGLLAQVFDRITSQL
jgi:hypothetical protein